MRNEACSVYTVNHLQQPTRSFILNSFVCFYLKYKYGCNIQYSKLIPKHLEAIKEKKIAQSFVKMSRALQIGHWEAVAGLPGPPWAVTQPGWPGSAAPAVPALQAPNRELQLLSPKPRVVSQYRPWATKATGHSHTGQGGYIWGRFGHFLSVQIKYSFFVSLLQIN